MRVRVCAGGAARAHAPRAGGLGAGRVGARGGGAGLARAPQQDAGRAHQDTRRTQDRRSVTTFIFDWNFFMFVTSLRLNAPIFFIRMLVLPVSYFDLIQFLKSFFVLIFVLSGDYGGRDESRCAKNGSRLTSQGTRGTLEFYSFVFMSTDILKNLTALITEIVNVFILLLSFTQRYKL